jgi:UDP-N-acetylglucosamine--N-acetylmuramyl-(pentapeptide) pyrophosphoryl-undecaprenol N-acetylglucosamine transferase
MTILLIGGGSGGHITPLLAVARDLKKLDPKVKIIGVCEKNSKFVGLYHNEPTIDRVFQIRAGKYRRYAGLPWWKKVVDIKTLLLNIRDVFYLLVGYREARGLLKQLKPDAILIKGGFVAVPVGWAASKFGVPYITHDSDSTPGLANKIIAKNAVIHATGMPKELYDYPIKSTIFTGIPVSGNFKKVTPALRASYREKLGLSGCSNVIAVVGGSQGAEQLNNDMISISTNLMNKYQSLGIVHIAGNSHKKDIRKRYDDQLLSNERRRIIVEGHVDNMFELSGASDLVITRAGATSIAEFSLQSLPLILVPGKLAGGHQDKNAKYFVKKGAAVEVKYGNKEDLLKKISELLDNSKSRIELSRELFQISKPSASKELAEITLQLAVSSKKAK